MHATSVPIPGETLDFAFYSIMYEMLVFGIFTIGYRIRLALINTWHLLSLSILFTTRGSKMSRLSELLALVELMVVRGSFIDRLRAFLILASEADTHVGPCDRVSS